MLFEVGKHKMRILTAWGKGTEPQLEVADACYAAHAALSLGDNRLLTSELPFSRSHFSKYVSIGKDKRLRREDVRPLLPPKFSVLYELSLLEDEEFETFLREGRLTPSLKRTAIIKWRKKRRGETIKRFATDEPQREQGELDYRAEPEAVDYAGPVEAYAASTLLPQQGDDVGYGTDRAVETLLCLPRPSLALQCTLTVEASGIEFTQQVALFNQLQLISRRFGVDVTVSPEFQASLLAEAA